MNEDVSIHEKYKERLKDMAITLSLDLINHLQLTSKFKGLTIGDLKDYCDIWVDRHLKRTKFE